ncbi:MAG: acetyl/propionyl/methylcrotonyl-CoA carboxylase subunit alpha [Pseudomonadota bacterium]
MFAKLLIANRGEIACRVIATARRMGIATVAVYSDADASARHVRLADEAVRIGPAPAAESYLNIDALLAAAKATHAEAVHPGYGFLSENPAFVERIGEAGLVFVGPSPEAIRAMGLKDAAKRLMRQAGVPVVPGYEGEAQDTATLTAEAERIGYPVLIKARAGGGGKGMRRVERPEDFAEALEGAQREGQASFGDPRVLIEKWVTTPRHIEVQVFGDTHGHVVHLFERDCSLQRRHQKVIEEAPAPGMTQAMRAAMGQAAVRAAEAVGYVGAGTVEFIADASSGLDPEKFYFLEMNTRLQVEHPVTEAVTGLDLVELQLRIAAGAPLPFMQDTLALQGHAVEARLYAEDVARGFLPATGRLTHLALPHDTAFTHGPVRLDAGVEAGDAITPHYDPMIAKLIVHAPTRAEALARLAKALDACRIAGATANVAFLAALARHPGFGAGDVDTGLIEREIDALVAIRPPDEHAITAAALAGLGLLGPRPGDPWQALSGWHAWSRLVHPVSLLHGEEHIERRVRVLAPDRFHLIGADEQITEVSLRHEGDALSLTLDSHSMRLHLAQDHTAITVFAAGTSHRFVLVDPLDGDSAGEQTSDTLSAPMPGLVKRLRAAPGARVDKGAALVVLEAMKMEHTLTAPRTATVAEVRVAEGESVEDGTILLTLEPEDG